MPNPMPASSSVAANLAGLTAELVEIAERLTKVLARETELIRAMRVKEIGPLQTDKTDLTSRYQKSFKALVAANDGKSLPPAIKERLAVTGQHLAKAVTENELMLRVGKTATERLISSIVAAVKEQNKTTLSYAPQKAGPSQRFMTASAVNRQL
jgi:hypothetical protein